MQFRSDTDALCYAMQCTCTYFIAHVMHIYSRFTKIHVHIDLWIAQAGSVKWAHLNSNHINPLNSSALWWIIIGHLPIQWCARLSVIFIHFHKFCLYELPVLYSSSNPMHWYMFVMHKIYFINFLPGNTFT